MFIPNGKDRLKDSPDKGAISIRSEEKQSTVNSANFSEEALVLHLSDIHYGEVIDFPENTYNTEVADRRIETTFDKVILITNQVRATVPTRQAYIFLTGDMVHNELMRGAAKMSAEVNFVEQIIGVSNSLAKGILRMAEQIPSLETISILGVRGNHGRVGIPGENDPGASLDVQVYDRLGLLLNENKKITMEISPYPYIWVEIMGYSFVAEHADSVRSQMGIPFYGLNRLRDRRYKNLSGKMDYLLVGHWHQQYIQSDGTVEVLMCPSMVGMNDYSLSFGGGHLVRQMMYMVHPEQGITMYIPLNLEK